METSTIHQADGGGEEEWAESQQWAESQHYVSIGLVRFQGKLKTVFGYVEPFPTH